ncbi:MAG: peptidoglycan-associated lipoprotein Pal [Gammaproteobacteria bacterium]|nr:peptidoglycan-associated lipoprotein Pal [Gammaproteobacteria bacterium]NNC97170.1 peptidoglycan-associated lipoprotein Pal [Gammaproteobacteria bacterium]NNM13637.1 peptidoglycan-associated lipoprotein Pal [Gammaproteobacteria bacterium]
MGRMVNGEFIPNPDYQAFNPLDQTIIYFDFDQSSIKPEFRDVLAAHAANLAANPGLSLRLEGHADERGSREYNIGLGERRAQAVKRALMLNGVSAASLKTVSFGEEKPMVQGTGEASWSQNRRVELVYR